tara:strand:- start:189 stop:1004 length:816 start_codon:yes stop_codon:yes gene_type:complete
MNQKTLNAMETAVFENAVREEKERITRTSRNYTRRHLGEIDKARALEIQKKEKEAKEIKADDYFEDMDMVTEGLAQRERIEAIIQWAHSQEIKTSLFEVSALRFHQQQHGLATKEEYRILTGRMVSFWYLPKTREKMESFDRYPLVLVIKRHKDGFTGLNFHYLGLRERAELLTYLRDRLAWEHDPSKTRLQITYKILMSKTRYKYFWPCIKTYKKEDIKSRFISIKAKNWDKAIILPIESFEGTIPLDVIWRNSKRQAIRESNKVRVQRK